MKPSRLDAVRAYLRRGQLLLGLGFASAVLGAVLAGTLLARMGPGAGVLGLGIRGLLSRLWILGVLPLMGFAAGRIVDLRPWRAAITMALTGEAFYVALDLVQGGLEGLARQGLWLVFRVLTLVGGVILTRGAIVRARGAAERARQKAILAAEARQAEYNAFSREAERLASLDRGKERTASPGEPPTGEG